MHKFWEEYLHILSNPAHLAVEITLMILLDVILLGLIVPFLKRSISTSLLREHARIDKEHGIFHHDGHVHRTDPLEDNCELDTP
jgi:hypothetical protein